MLDQNEGTLGDFKHSYTLPSTLTPIDLEGDKSAWHGAVGVAVCMK